MAERQVAGGFVHLLEAFRKGLHDTGYVEGESIFIEYRWANGDYDRLPALASELVNRGVALLVAVGGDPSAIAAKKATSTIPIVFGMGGDPVDAGLVVSFNRPGGNATGYTLLTNQIEPKRIGLLHELMPGASLLGALINPTGPAAARQLADIENAARVTSQNLFVARASKDAEVNAAFASFVHQRVGAVLIAADPYFDTRRDQIIALASHNRIPAMYQFREFAVAGGLISFLLLIGELVILDAAVEEVGSERDRLGRHQEAILHGLLSAPSLMWGCSVRSDSA